MSNAQIKDPEQAAFDDACNIILEAAGEAGFTNKVEAFMKLAPGSLVLNILTTALEQIDVPAAISDEAFDLGVEAYSNHVLDFFKKTTGMENIAGPEESEEALAAIYQCFDAPARQIKGGDFDVAVMCWITTTIDEFAEGLCVNEDRLAALVDKLRELKVASPSYSLNRQTLVILFAT